MTFKNPMFDRFISVHPGECISQIVINYQPKSYWSDAISLKFDFRKEKTKQNDLKVGEDYVSYDLVQQSNLKSNIDPLAAAKNYIAALNDAVAMAEKIVDLLEMSIDFKTLAQYLLRQDMAQTTLETLPTGQESLHILLVSIGDGVMVANDQIWSTQAMAEEHLSKLASEVSFEIREGSPIERNYWWLQYHHWGKEKIR